MQWLFVIFTYGVIYGCLLTNVFGLDLTDNIRTLVVVVSIQIQFQFPTFSYLTYDYFIMLCLPLIILEKSFSVINLS